MGWGGRQYGFLVSPQMWYLKICSHCMLDLPRPRPFPHFSWDMREVRPAHPTETQVILEITRNFTRSGVLNPQCQGQIQPLSLWASPEGSSQACPRSGIQGISGLNPGNLGPDRGNEGPQGLIPAQVARSWQYGTPGPSANMQGQWGAPGSSPNVQGSAKAPLVPTQACRPDAGIWGRPAHGAKTLSVTLLGGSRNPFSFPAYSSKPQGTCKLTFRSS